MSLSIRIDVHDAGISERMEQLFAGLTDRTEIHEAIGKREMIMTRDYLTEISGYRHRTAENLGGTPTGFLERAAEQTSMSADSTAATLSIDNPGIVRALRPVTITPTEGRNWLTLAMAGISYGRTVAQIQDMIGKRLFRPNKKGGGKMNVLAAKDGDGLKLYFALVASVTQPQDRSLLPSDQAFTDAAMAGVRDWLDYALFWKETA